jgi:hypothetical protein
MRMVGRKPSTWRAKLEALTTSTEETREPMMRLRRLQLSIEMALALPFITTVDLLHWEMRMEWEMDASTSIMPCSLS